MSQSCAAGMLPMQGVIKRSVEDPPRKENNTFVCPQTDVKAASRCLSVQHLAIGHLALPRLSRHLPDQLRFL